MLERLKWTLNLDRQLKKKHEHLIKLKTDFLIIFVLSVLNLLIYELNMLKITIAFSSTCLLLLYSVL